MSFFSISFSIPCLPAAFTGLFSPHDLAQKHSQPTQLKLVFHLQSDLTLRGSWRYSSAGENLTGLKKKKDAWLKVSSLFRFRSARKNVTFRHFCLRVVGCSELSVLWLPFTERFLLFTAETASRGSAPLLLVNTRVWLQKWR